MAKKHLLINGTLSLNRNGHRFQTKAKEATNPNRPVRSYG